MEANELRPEGRTVTRADLAEAVYRELGLSRTESAAMVEMVLAEISDTIVSGETVKLSSFGSFVVRSKGQRVGRNPKTGKEVPIPPRRVTVFKPSNIMKQRINECLAPEEETGGAAVSTGADAGNARRLKAAEADVATT
ncbi:integration host factor subunit alpha [Afifella aestuarii]|uniref:integration host factor subunit alpha n=1 Tax=Afifella aestuarii TaxID=1909496 RepID=UPI000FE2C8D3|nr:integration host factor subunit alpha [Afifella aestuarii]